MSDYAGGVTGHSGNWTPAPSQPSNPSSPGPTSSAPATAPGLMPNFGIPEWVGPNLDTNSRPSTTPTTSDSPPLIGGNAAAGGDAHAQITDYLGQYGLGDLGDFAWKEFVSGVPLTQIFLDIRKTDTFKTRFPAMDARGKAGHAISPAQYVNLEQQFTTILRSAGLPKGFYDSPADFTNWIAGEVSPTEIADRVNQGLLKVSMAPPEVRAAFGKYFGANGDQALASFFLDPERATPQLVQMADAAIVGGTGKRFGFDINLPDATRLAQLGVTAASAQQGFQRISDIAPVFSETVSEGQDLTASHEGMGAAFGLDATSQRAIDQRLQERKAAFTGDGGGPQLTGTGSSIGSART